MKKFNDFLKDLAVDFRNMGMSLERKNKSNPFGKPRGTLKGEVTRSTAEARVANFLFKNGIEYSYEKKKIVKDYWMEGNHFKPDFYLPRFNIFIEYWGRINNEYNERMNEKKIFYRNKGIPVIDLFYEDLPKIGQVLRREFERVKGYPFPDTLKYESIYDIAEAWEIIDENPKIDSNDYLSLELYLRRKERINVWYTAESKIKVLILDEENMNLLEKGEVFFSTRELSCEKIPGGDIWKAPYEGNWYVALCNTMTYPTEAKIKITRLDF